MKCTCPTQRPNARDPTQPIFHWKWGLRLLPNAKKSTHKKLNVQGQRKKLASPNAKDTNMLVFFALGDAKILSFALGDAKVPDARYFAFWWNIGLSYCSCNVPLKMLYLLCPTYCYLNLKNNTVFISVIMTNSTIIIDTLSIFERHLMKVWKNGEIVLKQSDQILQTVIRWIIQIWRSNKSNKVAQRMFLYHVTTRFNMAVNLSKHKVRFYKQMPDRGPQVVLVLCRNLVLIPPFDTVVETPVLRACLKDSKYMYIDMGLLIFC